MTEWEQIKKEYREIPVPANGPHQLLQTIAEAKRKRNRIKRLAKYGTVAAAALLVLLLPGTLLFSGGFGANSENMFMEADCVAESVTQSATEDGWFMKGTLNDRDTVPASNSTPAPESTANNMTNAGGSSMEREEEYKYSVVDMLADANLEVVEEKVSLGLEDREIISKEILRQMEERMQMDGETYYCKSEEYPEGFELISEEQEYYINGEGLLVIVFEAGVVAPEQQGMVEFIIPAEVFRP